MTWKDVIWFWRPTIGVILCFLIAFGLSYAISQKNANELSVEMEAAEQLAAQMGDLVDPDPSIAPEEVVRIQATALAKENGPDGILQCMNFASPDNLALTGPIEKFGRMVRGEQFAPLAAPDAVVVGDPVFQEDQARVLVTVVSKSKLRSYVWVLAKQQSAPYEDCWLTDGVFPLRYAEAFESDEI